MFHPYEIQVLPLKKPTKINWQLAFRHIRKIILPNKADCFKLTCSWNRKNLTNVKSKTRKNTKTTQVITLQTSYQHYKRNTPELDA